MFCQIEYSSSVGDSILYSEKKCATDQARCLLAENFLKDKEKLSQKAKVKWMERLTCLNERATQQAFHLTLNFSPADTHLQDHQFAAIAMKFMEEVGLGLTPYLVYRHFDAGHPHLHIIAPKIKANGDIIPWAWKDYYRSQKIARSLEKQFSLTPRTAREQASATQAREKQLGNAQIVRYGKTPLMPAISKVLDQVLREYQFATMEEFNAILRVYNVRADRGREGSRLYQQKGLLYRALDEQGKDIGAPIKASLFNCKPTLPTLEAKFRLEQQAPRVEETMVRLAVDGAFYRSCRDAATFANKMRMEGISLVYQKDATKGQGELYYVSHKAMRAFKASSLGEDYTAKAIAEKIGQQQELGQDQSLGKHKKRGRGR